MRIANLDGRACFIVPGWQGDVAIDIHEASGGALGPTPGQVYAQWDRVRSLYAGVDRVALGHPFEMSSLRCPVPEPRQVFAIGLNYRAHALETGAEISDVPVTFTKFPASLAGPHDEIDIVGDRIDWEVELVAVIGRRADRVTESDAWSHVAGLTVGQDISDRALQHAAGRQFSLGKSRRGYGPMGPWVVSVDEFDNPDDLALGCSVDGEVMQDARTSDLIMGVPRLVAELAAVLPLLPGDVIFTGTPSGVGNARKPPRYLAPGHLLESWIEGIGRLSNRCRVGSTTQS